MKNKSVSTLVKQAMTTAAKLKKIGAELANSRSYVEYTTAEWRKLPEAIAESRAGRKILAGQRMTPAHRTAARLASLGIYAMRGRAGWYLYQCGVETAIKLNLNFSRTEFQAIEATQLAEGRPLTTKQIKLLTGIK